MSSSRKFVVVFVKVEQLNYRQGYMEEVLMMTSKFTSINFMAWSTCMQLYFSSVENIFVLMVLHIE